MASLGDASDRVSFHAVDLSTHDGVRDAAARVLAEHDRIDAIPHSTGVMVFKDVRTADGLHPFFAVNYLSRYRLTQLLLPALRNAERGQAGVGQTSLQRTADHTGVTRSLRDDWAPAMYWGKTGNFDQRARPSIKARKPWRATSLRLFFFMPGPKAVSSIPARASDGRVSRPGRLCEAASAPALCGGG
ncbi:SDR family NAD(P)-dependent oxidoreductase [Streptomyces sp. NPDC096311]|uniref:SDR family NAD(P)-dependent oxidoreductase n=1 Tax=Streptomyces sp. NPDC096311 TaxID=3366083 RepID=UPI00382249ED